MMVTKFSTCNSYLSFQGVCAVQAAMIMELMAVLAFAGSN